MNSRINSSKAVLSKTLIYTVLVITSVFLMLPFFWMLSTSLKAPEKVFLIPIQWIPTKIMWNNYYRLLVEFEFYKYIINSVWLTAINIFGYVASCSLVSFAFATQKWKHKNKVFLLVLATMMLPKEVIFFPRFILFKFLGWYGTMLPLWVPSLFADAFLIFLMRQFFLSIPTELYEASIIDGCSRFRVFWNIYMPLSKPVLASAAIFVFMYFWNDFFGPLIFITKESMRTAALALMYFKSGYSYDVQNLLPVQMAGALLTALPCLALYYFAQRYFIAGIVMKGVDK
jgi:ABC-type glycerol-3-phosphate transport system permease component